MVAVVCIIAGCTYVATKGGYMGAPVALRARSFGSCKAAVERYAVFQIKRLASRVSRIGIAEVVFCRLISTCLYPDFIARSRGFNGLLDSQVSLCPIEARVAVVAACFYIANASLYRCGSTEASKCNKSLILI